MKDHKKHLQHDETGDWQDNKPERSKSKPREIEYILFIQMTRDRDGLWWKEGKFREYLTKKYGL